VQEVAAALRAALDDALCGQSQAKTGLLLALIAREHAYLEGPPGCGKSALASALAVAASSRSAAVRCHRDLREQDVMGDVRLQRSSGPRGERLSRGLVPGPLLAAELVVLDDLPRAPAEALAPLLRMLSERRALGRALPLETVIATAVPPELDLHAESMEVTQLDRFAVQVRMHGLLTGRDWARARRVLAGDDAPRAAPIDRDARIALQRAAAALPFAPGVTDRLRVLVRRLVEVSAPEERPRLTDRSLGRAALALMRAHAVTRGSSRVELQDLAAVRFLLGRRVSEDVQGAFPVLLAQVLANADTEAGPPPVAGHRPGQAAGARGGGARQRVVAAPAEVRDDALAAVRPAGSDAPSADVSALLGALAGRIERGRADTRENPGGPPRSYRRMRRLDEIFDADPLEAVLFAEASLPDGPRVFRRERREAGGSLVVLRDVSASMEGRLARWTGQVVAGIVRLGARRHMRLGYVEFNHDATRFTSGGLFFHRRYAQLLALAGRRRAEGRTNYEAPLALALEEFRRRPGRGGHIVLLTDGVPVLGDPTVERERALARRLGVRVHTVFLGLGDCPEVLERIALETDGLRFEGRPTADGHLCVSPREDMMARAAANRPPGGLP
jgi:MoxR-like ATPase